MSGAAQTARNWECVKFSVDSALARRRTRYCIIALAKQKESVGGVETISEETSATLAHPNKTQTHRGSHHNRRSCKTT